MDFADTTELENANRGFLAAPDTLDLRDEEGRAVWTQDAYAFLDKDAPDTANPSLWRNAQLNQDVYKRQSWYCISLSIT